MKKRSWKAKITWNIGLFDTWELLLTNITWKLTFKEMFLWH